MRLLSFSFNIMEEIKVHWRALYISKKPYLSPKNSEQEVKKKSNPLIRCPRFLRDFFPFNRFRLNLVYISILHRSRTLIWMANISWTFWIFNFDIIESLSFIYQHIIMWRGWWIKIWLKIGILFFWHCTLVSMYLIFLYPCLDMSSNILSQFGLTYKYAWGLTLQ